jgi:hypothetical protein
MANVLVLGAGGSAGVNFRKSLQQTGSYTVLATDTRPSRLHQGSWADIQESPRVDAPDRRTWEERISSIRGINLIYAQADKEVERAYEWNDPRFGLLPPRQHLLTCRDKLYLNETLDQHKVNVPWSHGVYNREIGKNFIGKDACIWVRARTGAGSKAALPCYSDMDVIGWIHYWSEHPRRPIPAHQFMVCEYLPGREFAWQAIYHKGELVVAVTRERLEYVFQEQMPSGQSSTPSKAKIVHEPQAHAAGLAAIAALGGVPNGIYGVDMKCDGEGVPCVTEINVGRFYSTSFFYAMAGCNLPDIYCRLSLGEKVDYPGVDPIPAGAVWNRTMDEEPFLTFEL